LSNIIGILNLFDTSEISELNKQLVNYLRSSASQLQNTIHDLSEIISIRNRETVAHGTIHLGDLFNKLKKNFLNTINDIPHYIHADFGVEEIISYKPYIESIFINLLSNAIKYRSLHKSLTIQVTTSLDAAGNYLLQFTDNGLGIDTERYHDRIFGLYQRFHESYEGKGLGLFMVKAQVTALGGTISLQSKVDEGSTFTIIIPAKSSKLG
jgi:signal transduction histidine kinase